MRKPIHSGNIVLIGFGVMIIFMSVLVFLCTQNPAIMVSKNYYEEELTYQDRIDAKNNTASFDDALTMNKGNGLVTITVPEGINKELKKARLDIYSLNDDKKDQNIELTPNPEGIYTVNTQDWAKGNYRLKLSLDAGDKQYYKEFPF